VELPRSAVPPRRKRRCRNGAGFPLGFLAALIAHTACDGDTNPTEGVVVYERIHFGGNVLALGGDLGDLDGVRGPCRGFFDSEAESHWDDCISSLRPFPGWEAVLFEHDRFEGRSLTVTGEMRDLRLVSGPCDGSWDDCASSIQVRRRP
jgi:hypothetical protein